MCQWFLLLKLIINIIIDHILLRCMTCRAVSMQIVLFHYTTPTCKYTNVICLLLHCLIIIRFLAELNSLHILTAYTCTIPKKHKTFFYLFVWADVLQLSLEFVFPLLTYFLVKCSLSNNSISWQAYCNDSTVCISKATVGGVQCIH